jgi:hypothetical protein
MNIQDLIHSGAKINVTVYLDDLKEWHKFVISETKRQLEEIILSDKAEIYPSPKQVTEILDVNLSTLYRGSKRGYLLPFEVGGKRRYKMIEV